MDCEQDPEAPLDDASLECDVDIYRQAGVEARRSSILKPAKCANIKIPEIEDTEVNRKSLNNKRVSFANTFQVKELHTGNIYDIPGYNELDISKENHLKPQVNYLFADEKENENSIYVSRAAVSESIRSVNREQLKLDAESSVGYINKYEHSSENSLEVKFERVQGLADSFVSKDIFEGKFNTLCQFNNTGEVHSPLQFGAKVMALLDSPNNDMELTINCRDESQIFPLASYPFDLKKGSPDLNKTSLEPCPMDITFPGIPDICSPDIFGHNSGVSLNALASNQESSSLKCHNSAMKRSLVHDSGTAGNSRKHRFLSDEMEFTCVIKSGGGLLKEDSANSINYTASRTTDISTDWNHKNETSLVSKETLYHTSSAMEDVPQNIHLSTSRLGTYRKCDKTQCDLQEMDFTCAINNAGQASFISPDSSRTNEVNSFDNDLLNLANNLKSKNLFEDFSLKTDPDFLKDPKPTASGKQIDKDSPCQSESYGESSMIQSPSGEELRNSFHRENAPRTCISPDKKLPSASIKPVSKISKTLGNQALKTCFPNMPDIRKANSETPGAVYTLRKMKQEEKLRKKLSQDPHNEMFLCPEICNAKLESRQSQSFTMSLQDSFISHLSDCTTYQNSKSELYSTNKPVANCLENTTQFESFLSRKFLEQNFVSLDPKKSTQNLCISVQKKSSYQDIDRLDPEKSCLDVSVVQKESLDIDRLDPKKSSLDASVVEKESQDIDMLDLKKSSLDVSVQKESLDIDRLDPKKSSLDASVVQKESQDIAMLDPKKSSLDVSVVQKESLDINRLDPKKSSLDASVVQKESQDIDRLDLKKSCLDVSVVQKESLDIDRLDPMKSSLDVSVVQKESQDVDRLDPKKSSFDVPVHLKKNLEKGFERLVQPTEKAAIFLATLFVPAASESKFKEGGENSVFETDIVNVDEQNEGTAIDVELLSTPVKVLEETERNRNADFGFSDPHTTGPLHLEPQPVELDLSKQCDLTSPVSLLMDAELEMVDIDFTLNESKTRNLCEPTEVIEPQCIMEESNYQLIESQVEQIDVNCAFGYTPENNSTTTPKRNMLEISESSFSAEQNGAMEQDILMPSVPVACMAFTSLKKKFYEAFTEKNRYLSLKTILNDDAKIRLQWGPWLFKCRLMILLKFEHTQDVSMSFAPYPSTEPSDEYEEVGYMLARCLLTDTVIPFPVSCETIISKLTEYSNVVSTIEALMENLLHIALDGGKYILSENLNPLTVWVTVLNAKSQSKFSLKFIVNLDTYPNERIVPEVEHLDYNDIVKEVCIAVQNVETRRLYIYDAFDKARNVQCRDLELSVKCIE